MTFASIKHELVKAAKNKYAIPLFDVFDLYSVEGVLDAASSMKAPTIIGVYQSLLEQPNARALATYIAHRAADMPVSISLMLDHGASVDQCLRALDYGYMDVMYDGSQLPMEENIANTRRVVEAAHDFGAAVEAELGHVGLGSQYDLYGGQGFGFTDPAVVAYFVEQTGVDFLAVAFGNAHGLYKGQPRLNVDLLREIHNKVSIPLVMHGGTGLNDDQFRDAINSGISKINVATLILNQATEYIRQKAVGSGGNVFDYMGEIGRAYREICGNLYTVFGTAYQG